MAVLEVTARQFREKQKSFFELADIGKQIVIKRGNSRSYVLTPIDNYELVLTSALLEKTEKARQEMRDGKYTECLTYTDSLKHLSSL